jgi:hypothetical protein
MWVIQPGLEEIYVFIANRKYAIHVGLEVPTVWQPHLGHK